MSQPLFSISEWSGTSIKLKLRILKSKLFSSWTGLVKKILLLSKAERRWNSLLNMSEIPSKPSQLMKSSLQVMILKPLRGLSCMLLHLRKKKTKISKTKKIGLTLITWTSWAKIQINLKQVTSFKLNSGSLSLVISRRILKSSKIFVNLYTNLFRMKMECLVKIAIRLT